MNKLINGREGTALYYNRIPIITMKGMRVVENHHLEYHSSSNCHGQDPLMDAQIVGWKV